MLLARERMFVFVLVAPHTTEESDMYTRRLAWYMCKVELAAPEQYYTHTQLGWVLHCSSC